MTARKTRKPPAPYGEFQSAEIRDSKILAAPAFYTVSLFLGRGAFDRATANTLAEARLLAVRMLAAHPECCRRPLIYAVATSGASALVLAA